MTAVVADTCQGCGACCSYSAEWPRFTTDDEDDIALIPPAFVSADERGMRFENGRCAALSGTVGRHTACTIYGLRPDVCRVCQPGDGECLVARASFGLPALPPA